MGTLRWLGKGLIGICIECVQNRVQQRVEDRIHQEDRAEKDDCGAGSNTIEGPGGAPILQKQGMLAARQWCLR